MNTTTEILPVPQGTKIQGSYTFYEDDNVTPVNIEGRTITVKLVNNSTDKVAHTVTNANVTKSNNIAAFEIGGSITATIIGLHHLQIEMSGLSADDTPSNILYKIIEITKKY